MCQNANLIQIHDHNFCSLHIARPVRSARLVQAVQLLQTKAVSTEDIGSSSKIATEARTAHYAKVHPILEHFVSICRRQTQDVGTGVSKRIFAAARKFYTGFGD